MEFHWICRPRGLYRWLFQAARSVAKLTTRRSANMLRRYKMFAGYNTWCNERLYDATARIGDTDYRADRGVFFKSLHGTLNHLLVGDRIWMRRFTGQGEVPPGLGAILYDDFTQLRTARCVEDDR